MWDFSYELPAFFLLMIVFSAFHTLPRVPSIKNRFFSVTIWICGLTAFFNFISAWVDDNPGVVIFPVFIAVNTAYYLFFVARGFAIFYLYLILTDLLKSKGGRWIFWLAFAAAETAACFLIVNGSYFVLDMENYAIESGYVQLDILQMLLCVAMLITAVSGRKNISRRQFHCLVSGVIIDLIVALYDIFYPYILLSDMMSVIVLLLMYLAFLNPSIYFDREVGIFNFDGMKFMLGADGLKGRGVIAFSLKNLSVMREIYSVETVTGTLRGIGQELLSIPLASAYYLGEGCFAVFTENQKDADSLIETLIDRFHDRWVFGPSEIYYDAAFLKVTTEIPPVSYEQMRHSFEHVLENAHRDDVVIIDDDLVHSIRNENSIYDILKNSIRSDDVKMYLQPIVDASTEKLVGAEALARLRDEKMGLIPPSEFISVAEQTGLISELGEQMFVKACAFMETNEVPEVAWINVNVSPAQFNNISLSDQFLKIARKMGISQNVMHLEITETAYTSSRTLQQRAEAFTEKHFRIVLDDFGSGYSNLSRVITCPFSNVKLDMSFVWSCFEKKSEILKETIHLLHSMGFTVTAEGIETKEMADTLRSYGCDYFQGYYYSKPLPVNEFISKYKM